MRRRIDNSTNNETSDSQNPLINPLAEILDQIFYHLSTNEMLNLKLLNTAYYQQVMRYFLTNHMDLSHTLGAGNSTVFTIPASNLRAAIIKPTLNFDGRLLALNAMAASDNIELTVEDEVLNRLITKINLYSTAPIWKMNIVYPRLSIDIKFIAKYLRQEQISSIKKELINIPLITLKDSTSSNKHNWQSAVMRILKPFIKTESDFIFAPIHQKLTAILQKVKLRDPSNIKTYLDDLYAIAPYLSKNLVRRDITELLVRIRDIVTTVEITKENIACCGALTLLAQYWNNEQRSMLLKIVIESAKKDPLKLLRYPAEKDFVWEELVIMLEANAPYLDKVHMPLIAELYNLLPNSIDFKGFDLWYMKDCLLVSMAKKIKDSVLVPYLQILTNKEVRHIPTLCLSILKEVHSLIPNEHREEFASYIYNELNHKDHTVRILARELITHFIPSLSPTQITKVFAIQLALDPELPNIESPSLSSLLQKKISSLPNDKYPREPLGKISNMREFSKNAGIKLGALPPTCRGLSSGPADKPRDVGFSTNCQQVLDLQPVFDLLGTERSDVLRTLKRLAPYMLSENITKNLKSIFDDFYNEGEFLGDDGYSSAWQTSVDTLKKLAKNSTADQQLVFQQQLKKALESTNKVIQAGAVDILVKLHLDESSIIELFTKIQNNIKDDNFDIRNIGFSSLKSILPSLKGEQIPIALQLIKLGIDDQEKHILFSSIEILSSMVELDMFEDHEQRLIAVDLILSIPSQHIITEDLNLLAKITAPFNAQQVEEIFKKLINFYASYKHIEFHSNNGVWGLSRDGVINVLSYWLVTEKITPEQVKNESALMELEMLHHFVNCFMQIEPYNNNRLFKSQPKDAMAVEPSHHSLSFS